MSTTPSPGTRYSMPAFLKNKCTPAVYSRWLRVKSNSLLKRDKKRGKPYAINATESLYKIKIHKAVMENGEQDPYP
jgi:uncharacterized protein (DUF2344 family)